MSKAKWFKRDGWFVLIPPEKGLRAVADFKFEKYGMMMDFCAACGWVLGRGF